MATLITAAPGNFTAAATWKVSSAVAGAELDSNASSFTVSTGNSDSGTFVLAATNVDAVAIRILSIITPTGTFTCKLRNSTTSTDVATVTINCSDLRADASGHHVFSFGAITPNGTDAFLVRLTRSVADSGSNRVTIAASTASATNMSRHIRTVTTAAPASGDKLMIAGEFTGAGASTSYTITIDNTATTSFGPTVSGGPPEGITVNDKSTFTCGVVASTPYYLKWKGILRVNPGGILNTGTIGAAMPSTSSLTMFMDSAANSDSGIDIAAGGTWTSRGDPVTVKALLNADASVAATGLTTDIATAWPTGTVIGIATTTRTVGECEQRTTTGAASGTSITITVGLTNAHSGTNNANGDIRAEIVNLTRNIKITGASASLQGYITFGTTAAVDVQYVEFTALGSATASKRGIDVAITTGSLNFQYNALHDFAVASSLGLNLAATSGNNYTISNNVFNNIHTDSVTVAATTQVHTFDSNTAIKNVAGGTFNFSDCGCVFTNNTSAGSVGGGIQINEVSGVLGTFSGNVSHGGTSAGFIMAVGAGTMLNCRAWRNNSASGGFQITPQSGTTGSINVIVDGLIAFGNNAAGIAIVTRQVVGMLLFKNCVFNAGATLTQAAGLRTQCPMGDTYFENCTFGATTTHATGDIQIPTADLAMRVYMRNCIMGSATEVATPSNMQAGSFISSERNDQTAGLHKTTMYNGVNSIDTVLFNSASPSLRMTPTSASTKLESAPPGRGWMMPVVNGGTITVSVKVRESVLSDGTDYNGNPPRLIVRKNVAAGISSDMVLATSTNAAGNWETLTGLPTPAVTDDAILEFIVDVDGTTGWVNVDDLAVT